MSTTTNETLKSCDYKIGIDRALLSEGYLLPFNQEEGKTIHGEVLADEIGRILYLRCKYGKSDMQLMEKIKSDAMDAIMSLMEK